MILIKILIIFCFIQNADLLFAQQDSVSLGNYNKNIHLLVGFGNIEFINVGTSILFYHGLYCNVTGGEAFIQGEGFIIPETGSFLKLGISYRISEQKVSPMFSIDAGKLFLHVQESVFPLKISNEAYIASVMGGVEWRYENGCNLGVLLGGRYSARKYYADKIIYGFQIYIGYRADIW